MILTHIFGDWKAVIVCVLLLILYDMFDKYLRSRGQTRAEKWTVNYGQISKAAVFEGTYDATLTLWYSYQIPDEPHPISGEFQKEFASLKEAERWADNLSERTIPVRVNPANPWKSQLLDSELEAIVTSTAPICDTSLN
jgi:hypothetical protein